MHTNYGPIHTGATTVQAPVMLPTPTLVPVPTGLHNLPRPASRHFNGRQQEMAHLERAFRPGHETAPRPQRVTQAVSGLGGVGKSALALHYAHHFRPHYTATWWINAEAPETITTSMARLAAQANPHIDTGPAVGDVLAGWALAWLETHPGWLLVFDNASDPKHLAPYLSRLTGGDHLVTSRRAHDWHDLATHHLHLDVLTPTAATSLLRRLCGRDHPDERAAAAALADELGRLPLALEQASAHIRRTQGTYSGYLRRFRTETARMLTTPGDGESYGTTIAGSWRVTLDTIADRDPLAIHLLRVLAWLAPSDVPRYLLRRLGDDPGRQDDALALLADFSMIVLTPDAVAIHRPVQALARTPDPTDPHRSAQAIGQARSAAATALRRALPGGGAPETTAADWPFWRALLPHVDELVGHVHPDQDTEDTLHILYGASRFLSGQGQLIQAIAYARRSVTASTRLHGHTHPVTLTCGSDLASSHQEAGDLERAVLLFEQTLALREQVLGAHHLDTLASRGNLAAAYQAVGDFDLAVSLFEQTLAEREQVLGAHHLDTLVSENTLARAHLHAGDLVRAVELFERNLAACERTLGAAHPHTLTSRNNLACAYQQAGEVDSATALLERNLGERVRVLGTHHLDTLVARNNLASVYQRVGDVARAVELFERNLAAYERISLTHRGVIVSRNNLAGAHQEAGDVARAVALFERNLADCERLFSAAHPYTLTSRSNLVHAYQEVGDLERALELGEQALRIHEQFPATTRGTHCAVRGNLLYAYRAAGNREPSTAPGRPAPTGRERTHHHDADPATGPAKPPPWRASWQLVRPYVVTDGRAYPTGKALALVTLLVAVGDQSPDGLSPEKRRLMELCRPGTLSVVEAAAHVALPVSVAKVLLADLVDSAHLVARPPVSHTRLFEAQLLQEVLDGLRARVLGDAQ